MAETETRYQHDDGRRCTWDSAQGRWLQWAHEEGEPGPRDRMSYSCGRSHPDVSAHQPADRGEFGHPGVGIRSMITGEFIDEIQHYQYPGKVDGKVTRVANIMDEAQTLYKRKAVGYKGVEGDTADHLGAKGQFADINRKFWRLKAMIWDEVVEPYPDSGEGESVEEILMDFIGHAALTIDYLRQSQGHKEEGDA